MKTISSKCIRFESFLELAISLISSGAHDRLLIRYRLMSLNDLWKLPTRQMGVNSFKSDFTTKAQFYHQKRKTNIICAKNSVPSPRLIQNDL